MIGSSPRITPAKLYYYDATSSTMEVANLLQHEPELFGTYQQFLRRLRIGKFARVLVRRAQL